MSREHSEKTAVVSVMSRIADAIRDKRIASKDMSDVLLTIESMNHTLYGVKRLKLQKQYDFTGEEGCNRFADEMDMLVSVWEDSIARRSGKAIDKRFGMLYDRFKYVHPDEIYAMVMDVFFSLPQEQQLEYLTMRQRYTFLTHFIDPIENDYSLIEQHIEMMVRNVEDFRWLYEHLEDYRSKYVLVGIIEYWFDFDLQKLHRMTETVYSDYYDLDIISCDAEEVVVDLGAYTGDSILDYLSVIGEYKRIYAYELTPSTFETLKENLSGYSNVELRQKGVGAQNTTMYVVDQKNDAGNKMLAAGDTQVQIVTLDADIEEKVTMIKMDIEGAEKDAIMGARRHISEEKPKLLISTYHIPEDIFDIPRMIYEIRKDYKFYMRFNGHGIWPCDYVLFAV